tara:strand:+ start:208 stop:1032 length:825 start_codon:yes stop_codon:yes gene_type:complete
MISTKEADYLEQDEPIRNQNFVCLSFISPEEILKKKEVFFFEKYTEAYAKKNVEFVDTLQTLFPDKKEEIRILKDNYDFLFNPSKLSESYHYFVQDKSDALEKEFHEQNEFQTSIRGIKVRGVFDTIQEAQTRSEKLRKLENNKFSIFVAQVGCWCPWSPNPEHIENQEFAETELNTLMKKYEENQENKNQFFEQRKSEMKQSIQDLEKEKQKQNDRQLLGEEEEGDCGGSSTIQIVENGEEVSLELTGNTEKGKSTMYDEDDPWMKEKNVSKE